MNHFNDVNSALSADQVNALHTRAIKFAREECPAGACPIESELIRCVDEFVAGLSHTHAIFTYIPVLTMNHVRECITAGTCNLRGATA